MQTISSTAGAVYRTRLMEPTAAARFAACLRKNALFSGVAIEPSPRNPAKCFVAYVPATRKRRGYWRRM